MDEKQQKQINQKIVGIVKESLVDFGEVNLTTRLIEDLDLDSLNFLELTLDLENRIEGLSGKKIKFPDKDVKNLRTNGNVAVIDVVAYVETYIETHGIYLK
ncbi:acyl carrier protein [Candidatus Woesearchaeota archaeon]|nr:acyl carrier protein [Candidatus Woesearchaeota archaeon]